ncbi:MAG: autotransporter outer membrane beta-barrel domain-containing protein, partial [Opitutaceae bacterium]|nr:autotransporter outer membrane beta-barrel domain-containing protein [Opitutaceae bacterium]
GGGAGVSAAATGAAASGAAADLGTAIGGASTGGTATGAAAAAAGAAATGAAATSGASDAMWYGASIEFGCLLAPSKAFTLRPSIGLHYMNVAFDAYREYGPSAVQYPGIRQDMLQSIVALQGSWSFTTPWGWPALFDLRYGWRQNLADTDDEITVFFVGRPDLPMTVHSGGYSRGGQTVGLGLRAAAGKMTTLGLGYDYETAAGRVRHTITGNVRLSW